MQYDLPYLPREIDDQILQYLPPQEAVKGYVSIHPRDTVEDIGNFKKSYLRNRLQHFTKVFQIKSPDSVGYDLMKKLIPNYVTITAVANYQWNLSITGDGIITNNDIWLSGLFTANITNINVDARSSITFNIEGSFFNNKLNKMYILYCTKNSNFGLSTVVAMGEYRRGVPVGNHYIIIPTSNLGNLLIFDDTGLCTELVTFNLPNDYQLLNINNMINIPIIFDNQRLAYSTIDNNNNIIYEYNNGHERWDHFEKLENGLYLVDGKKKKQLIISVHGTTFYTP